jgi:hypothetical protein
VKAKMQSQSKVRMNMRVMPMTVIQTYPSNRDGVNAYHETDVVPYTFSRSDMQLVDKLKANKRSLDMVSIHTRGTKGKIIVAEIGSARRTTR